MTPCIPFKGGGCICPGGPVYTIGNRLVEIHSYFGPIVLNKRTHEPHKNQPGERSPFWAEFEEWEQRTGAAK